MSENKIYIHHHLGLGDHIICNGLVREFAKKFEFVYLFAKKHNFENVVFMYRDLKNLTVIDSDDNQAVNYILSNNLQKYYLRIGHENMIRGVNFDESFYKQVEVDFSKRWSSFYFERDLKREMVVYNELINSSSDYVVIHNTGSDGIDRIDYNKIHSRFKKIYLPKEYGMFDFIKIFENASEIHCIDSSFIHLINSLGLSNKKFFHKNYKNRNFDFSLTNDWLIY